MITKIEIKRYLRAIEIAKILFHEEGYHIEYLKSIETILRDLLKNSTPEYSKVLSKTSDK